MIPASAIRTSFIWKAKLPKYFTGWDVNRSAPETVAIANAAVVAITEREIVWLFLASGVVVLMAAQSLAAQRKGGGVLSGLVLGPDDKPVAHASVSYQSSGGNGAHVVHTDSHGHFSIGKLRADNYDLRASGKGVFSEWEKNVTLRAGQTKDLTLYLVYAKQIPKAYVKSNSKQ